MESIVESMKDVASDRVLSPSSEVSRYTEIKLIILTFNNIKTKFNHSCRISVWCIKIYL